MVTFKTWRIHHSVSLYDASKKGQKFDANLLIKGKEYTTMERDMASAGSLQGEAHDLESS